MRQLQKPKVESSKYARMKTLSWVCDITTPRIGVVWMRKVLVSLDFFLNSFIVIVWTAVNFFWISKKCQLANKKCEKCQFKLRVSSHSIFAKFIRNYLLYMCVCLCLFPITSCICRIQICTVDFIFRFLFLFSSAKHKQNWSWKFPL